jgi:hypothetical protein
MSTRLEASFRRCVRPQSQGLPRTKLMWCICRILLICGLLAIGSARATEASSRRGHPMNPPTSADAFWKKVLKFLNRNGGYATREQFTQTFGIHFGSVDPEHTVLTRQIAVISYRAEAGIDWYFDALFQEFTPAWNMPGDPAIGGAHIAWVITWRADSFGDPKKGQCITAAQVQRDLMATGWATPWPQWSMPVRVSGPSDIRPPPPVGNLGRQRDRGTERWGELPFGRLFPADAGPTSCVTGISMAARTSAK